MPGQVIFRVRPVLVEIFDHVHRAVHPPPMAGVGADVGVDARLDRGGVAEPLRRCPGSATGSRTAFSAGDVAAGTPPAGSPPPRRPCRLPPANLVEHHEVMRHQVVVLEHDFDRLARLHDNPVLVVGHLVRQRGQADHPHAQGAQLLARPASPRRPGAARPACRPVASRPAPPAKSVPEPEFFTLAQHVVQDRGASSLGQ